MNRLRLLAAALPAAVLAAVSTSAGDQADTAGIFDPGRVETYEIVLEPGVLEWERLNARKERFVPATLRFRGEEWNDAAMRFKGGFATLESCFNGSGRLICPKLSIKLRFDRFDAGGRFHGLRRLNFHSNVRDPSLLREHLAYTAFREAGVPAPRTAFARVALNGRLEGLFLVVEAIDQSFAERTFPDGGAGSLYKEVWPGCRDEQIYRRALRTHEIAEGARKMISLGTRLRDVPDGAYAEELSRWADVDLLLRYLAVDQVIGNWDGVSGWYCRGNGCPGLRGCVNHNYYWYQHASGDRLWLIPWDLDRTFEFVRVRELAVAVEDPCGPFYSFNDPDTIDAQACDPLLARLGVVLWDRYVTVARSLLDGPLSAQALEERIARLEALLAEHVAEDPNGPGLRKWRQAIRRLPEHVRALHGLVRDRIGGSTR